MKQKYYSKIIKNNYSLSKNNYQKASEYIGICNLSHLDKLTIYGPKVQEIINKFSIRDVTKIQDKSFFTVFLKNKDHSNRKYLGEAQVIKLNNYKYLLVGENLISLEKALNKNKKKYSLITIENVTRDYSFFAFHGKFAKNFFTAYDNPYIIEVNNQGYKYFTMIASHLDKFEILNNYKNLRFEEISVDIHNTFLHHHNVLTDLHFIKNKNLLLVLSLIYDIDNIKPNKTITDRNKNYKIKQFEATRNLIVTRKMIIYNPNRKKVGYIHNYYRLPNNKFPYVLGIINNKLNNNVGLLKVNKTDIIIKEVD